MSTDNIERSIDHELEKEAQNDELPAEVRGANKAAVQMDQLERLTDTSRENVIRLPVTDVSTTEERSVWTIECAHPFAEDPQFHLEKPITWSETNELVQLLDWYNVESRHPHILQTERLYVEYNEAEEEWDLVRPPDVSTPTTLKLRRWAETISNSFSAVTIQRGPVLFYCILFVSTIAGTIAADYWDLVMIVPFFFIWATFVGLILTEPES